MSGPALELRDVAVDYRRQGRSTLRSVAGVNLTVERGTVVGLVGESGCGKSSLARAAVGLLRPSAGEVLFEGEPVHNVTGLRRRRQRDVKLQMVFQDPFSSLNPRRTIGAQLADGLAAIGVASGRHEARVRELIGQVGLSAQLVNVYPHQLSGGQRQRLSIARALATEPSVIVADEPISSLDVSAQASIAKLLLSLSRELDVGILFSSHDLAVVRELADRIYVMYLGKIVESAPTTLLWANGLHPYSQALVAAIPEADGSGHLPSSLPGEVPDPAAPPSGCRFHPRCPLAFDRCAVDQPVLHMVAPDRSVACWLVDA